MAVCRLAVCHLVASACHLPSLRACYIWLSAGLLFVNYMAVYRLAACHLAACQLTTCHLATSLSVSVLTLVDNLVSAS